MSPPCRRPWTRQDRPLAPQGCDRSWSSDAPRGCPVRRARLGAPPARSRQLGASGAQRAAPTRDVRPRAPRGPCGDGPRGSRGRRGCACADGSHGSWRDAGCSAGRCAWSRESPTTSGGPRMYRATRFGLPRSTAPRTREKRAASGRASRRPSIRLQYRTSRRPGRVKCARVANRRHGARHDHASDEAGRHPVETCRASGTATTLVPRRRGSGLWTTRTLMGWGRVPEATRTTSDVPRPHRRRRQSEPTRSAAHRCGQLCGQRTAVRDSTTHANEQPR